MSITPERRKYMQAWREKHRKRLRIEERVKQKRLRQKRKQKRLCMWCGKPRDRKGKTYCSVCAKRHKVLRRKRTIEQYGITEQDYNRLLSKQKGGCGICHKPSKVKALAVDHDHEAGVVRGLLCGSCNNGLGRFKDSAKLLASAIDYLTRAKHELVYVEGR